jgi:hypothetical protein
MSSEKATYPEIMLIGGHGDLKRHREIILGAFLILVP